MHFPLYVIFKFFFENVSVLVISSPWIISFAIILSCQDEDSS